VQTDFAASILLAIDSRVTRSNADPGFVLTSIALDVQLTVFKSTCLKRLVKDINSAIEPVYSNKGQ
jgi:hypothetical protein